MKRIISLIVVMAMMLASVLAIIPVSATTAEEENSVSTDINAAGDNTAAETDIPAVVTRFLPEVRNNRSGC